MRNTLFLSLLAIAFLSTPRTAAAADACSTFGGRGTVIQVNPLGILPIVLADTGNVDSIGGANQASLLDATVAGLLSAKDLHATVVAFGANSRAETSLSGLNITVAGNTIGADFVMARGSVTCGSAGPSVNGLAEIDALLVNGQNVLITGFPNQVVSLLGGAFMILNEQTSSINGPTASMTVNAIHVSAPGVDLVIGADAVIGGGVTPFGVTGGGSGPCALGLTDFVTGGGWILAPPPPTAPSQTDNKGTFGVGGGCKNGQLWGHLEYHDHGTGLNVHGTQVTNYVIVSTNDREIEGFARVNGVDNVHYIVDVTDNGEPGTTDTFTIHLDTAPAYDATGPLQGGNIQIHSGL
jgi:hypothetical protein